MSEEKEPTSFTDWHKNAFNKLKETLLFNAKKAEIPIQKRINELRDSVARGNRARNLVQLDVWKDDLIPFFQEECGGPMAWVPEEGKEFNITEVNAKHFFQSGKAVVLQRLLARLKRYSEEGVRAEAELEFEKKKIEQMKKAAQFR